VKVLYNLFCAECSQKALFYQCCKNYCQNVVSHRANQAAVQELHVTTRVCEFLIPGTGINISTEYPCNAMLHVYDHKHQ